MKESVIYQDWIAKGEARGIAQGIAQGEAQGISFVASNLIKQGLDLEQIAAATGLTLEQLQQMRQEME